MTARFVLKMKGQEAFDQLPLAYFKLFQLKIFNTTVWYQNNSTLVHAHLGVQCTWVKVQSHLHARLLQLLRFLHFEGFEKTHEL